MSDQIERAIPATCPSCGGNLAKAYDNHCETHWCGWVVCGICDTVVDNAAAGGRRRKGGRRDRRP